MEKRGPGTLLADGRYRLERLLVAHDGVTIWEAADLHRARSVRLSVFDRGSTMIDCGETGGVSFVAVDPPPRPRLELVEISDEDAFFDEPPPPELFDEVPASKPSHGWRWAGAIAACAAIGLAGFHFFPRARALPTSAVTLTEARVAVAPTAAPPPPPAAVAAPPDAAPRAPDPPPARVSHPAPKRRAPPRHAPHRPRPRPATSAPLTL